MHRSWSVREALAVAGLVGWLSGCTGSGPDPDTSATGETAADSGPQVASALEYPLLDCDPLVPEFCGYPFPSNVYTVADERTATGRRVAFGKGLLQGNESGPWDDSDGFSAGTPILAQLPGATPEGLVPSSRIPESLEEGALTLLLDVETGERVAHWAELDVRAEDDAERSLVIYPAVRLRDDARYIVGVRGLVDDSGAAVPSSPVFAALRDGTSSEDGSVEPRRALYDDIFEHLDAAGWARSEVQLAWDFSTASDENNTRWLLHMREVGLGLVKDGVQYTIDNVDEDFATEHIAYRIQGTLEVPLFMNRDNGLAVMLFDRDGMPRVNTDTPWAQVPFEVLVPHSATKSPGALIQYGHGLFGSHTQIRSSHFLSFIDEYNYVLFGVDLQGMASVDAQAVGIQLANGDFDGARTMWDRLHQGFLNSLVAMRMMKTTFAEDATYGKYIDPSRAYYYGISQGGISGSVYLALSQDVERGALGVMGQPYSLLLMRSVDFSPFLEVIDQTWPDPRAQQLLVALTQMPWDRVEPTGYTHHIATDTFAGTSPKEVLMRVAIGDHQVPTLGAHIMARTLGAAHLTTGLRDVWGLEPVSSTSSGSFYTEYAFGLPEVPDCGVPMDVCEDPHGKVRRLDVSAQQLDEFLRKGTGTNYCEGGVCSFPDLSGCEPGEDDALTEARCALP